MLTIQPNYTNAMKSSRNNAAKVNFAMAPETAIAKIKTCDTLGNMGKSILMHLVHDTNKTNLFHNTEAIRDENDTIKNIVFAVCNKLKYVDSLSVKNSVTKIKDFTQFAVTKPEKHAEDTTQHYLSLAINETTKLIGNA
jgi:hypothetical protein